MVSEARGYRGGVQIWRVLHDPEKGHDHLETEGALPPGAARVEAALRAEQAADDDDLPVDYIFDVAPKIAASLCGFQLGEQEPEGFTWTRLRRPKGKGFFAKLFGGR